MVFSIEGPFMMFSDWYILFRVQIKLRDLLPFYPRRGGQTNDSLEYVDIVCPVESIPLLDIQNIKVLFYLHKEI